MLYLDYQYKNEGGTAYINRNEGGTAYINRASSHVDQSDIYSAVYHSIFIAQEIV